jgi:hypothetical protein
VVYDDRFRFTTVNSIKIGAILSNGADLCSNNCELVTDENFMLSPEWTDNRPEQSSIHWLESHLDPELTTVDNVFPNDIPSSLTQNEGASMHQNKGAALPCNEGDNESHSLSLSNEGASLDPFTGIHQQHSSDVEPAIRRSQRITKPTKRLIEDPIFGLQAICQPKFERFNLCKKAL